MRPKGDVEAAKGRVPLLLLVELLFEMRGSGSGVDCCCLSSSGDNAERAQPEGSGVAEEEEAALARTETAPPPPLAAGSRLPDEAAACLSRA